MSRDVSITKPSKPISSDLTDLKSRWRQFIYCWMCDITANKHQRQECLAGDEKSGPVMRGYEPFLSYLLSCVMRNLAQQQQLMLSCSQGSWTARGCPVGSSWDGDIGPMRVRPLGAAWWDSCLPGSKLCHQGWLLAPHCMPSALFPSSQSHRFIKVGKNLSDSQV